MLPAADADPSSAEAHNTLESVYLERSQLALARRELVIAKPNEKFVVLRCGLGQEFQGNADRPVNTLRLLYPSGVSIVPEHTRAGPHRWIQLTRSEYHADKAQFSPRRE